MHDLTIHFTYPWLLLLLIPAAALLLIPYFRMAKKYRKTRNRILSMVLHGLVMICSVFALAGMSFDYKVNNDTNEVMLVVDMSDTEEQSQADRDEFVKTVLNYGKFNNYNVGVVTFGFDQQYAVPLTQDVRGIYDRYMKSPLPDTSATNIAGALNFAKEQFTNPATAKIVLITDAKETDDRVANSIRAIAAEGIKIDTAYIPSSFDGADVRIMEIKTPDQHVNVGDSCTITVSLQSKNAKDAYLKVYDNDVLITTEDNAGVELTGGLQSVSVTHTFATEGLHRITAEIDIEEDWVGENNVYSSYINIEVFNRVLIIEQQENESQVLKTVLSDFSERVDYHVDVINIKEPTVSMHLGAVNELGEPVYEEIPTAEINLEHLRRYDQIILNNIADRDLVNDKYEGTEFVGNTNAPDDFDKTLERYVKEYGGGLFTVGGNRTGEAGVSNAYNRADMFNTTYGNMLPVEVVNYTPPMGVMVVFDRSGSMSLGVGEHNNLYWAKVGLQACLDALSERDYIGITTLDSDYEMVLPLTSRTQQAEIENAINGIQQTQGSTIFSSAIQRAGMALRTFKDNIKVRHMVLISDGDVAGEGAELYEQMIQDFYQLDGITLSVVQINGDSNSVTAMKRAAELGGGRWYGVTSSTASKIQEYLVEDLTSKKITDQTEGKFNPVVADTTSAILRDVEYNTPNTHDNKLQVQLGGFYGVRLKANANMIIKGEYDVPIYAQWKYGKGMVGSFMCDLNGTWSSEFIGNSSGRALICNVVANLMPQENIKPQSITVELSEDNYTNRLSLFTSLQEGEYVTGKIVELTAEGEVETDLTKVTSNKNATCLVTAPLSAENGYSRCNFVVKKGGVYRIELTKHYVGGQTDTVVTYKRFSYSAEYNSFDEVTDEELRALMADISNKSNGSVIQDLSDPVEIYQNFVTELPRSFDPRVVLMVTAMVLFLLEIIVRKFKFKWLHEIIRDKKQSKQEQNNDN